MSTWYIKQKVEIDTAAAGSHRETKREIDYTQIVALWMTLCSHHLLIPDLNQKLSHIWHGTSCTAQPTADGMLLLSVQKAKRHKSTDRSKWRNYNIFSKYEKSRVEKSAQIFGSLRALTAVSHSLLVLELSRKKGVLQREEDIIPMSI